MLLCLVPRPHYSARSKRFRSCGPSKDVRPTHKFSNVRKRRPQGLPAFQYGGAILESEKTLETRLRENLTQNCLSVFEAEVGWEIGQFGAKG